MSLLSPQSALIYTMVVVSASDARMGDRELHAIGELVKTLPAFRGFDSTRLLDVAKECAAVLEADEGLEAALGMIVEALAPPLRETAYVLALDVALADKPLRPEEDRVVQRLRGALGLDRLVSAAIERAAFARFRNG